MVGVVRGYGEILEIQYYIIVSGYNQQEAICRVIKSALEHSYNNLEVIYVDDASTDNSVETIKRRFPDNRLKIIQSQKIRGLLLLAS